MQDYVTNARTPNCWHNFYKSKVKSRIRKYGEHFCLVIKHALNDSYVIPYDDIKELYCEETLSPGGNRWVGVIIDGTLKVRGKKKNIMKYHNAVGLMH